MTFRSSIAALLALSVFASASAWASGAAPSRKSAVSEAYLLFEPFQVSVLENYRVRGMVTLEVYLQVPDEDLRHKTEEQMARLRDAFVRALADYGTHVAQADRPPDINIISRKLQDATDELMGRGAHVLITQAYVRRTG